MASRRWPLWGLGVAAGLLVAGRALSAVAVERAFHAALGVPGLFTERWTDLLLWQGGAWLLGTAFAFANLHAVRRTILAVAVPARVANLEVTAMVPGPRLLLATVLVAALVGALLAAPMDHWPLLALARHGLPFGEIEGVLGRDLGFYVFWLPLEEALYLWALVSTVTVSAMVVVLYALTRSLRMEGRRIAASTHVRRHLSVLGALVLLLLAWSYRLDAFDLLQGGSGPDGLFTPVDHRFTLRIDFLLSMGSAAAALVLLRAGWLGQLRTAFIALSTVLLAAVGLRHVVPTVLHRQQARVPDATLPAYREMRALFSRHAFGVGALRRAAPGDTVAAPFLPEEALADGVAWPGAGSALAHAAAGDGAAPPAALVGWRVLDGRLGGVVAVPPAEEGGSWAVQEVSRVPLALSADSGALVASDPVEVPAVVAPGAVGHRVVRGRAATGVRGAALTSGAARVAHAWALRDPSLLGRSEEGAGAVVVVHRDVRERLRRLVPVFAQGERVTPLRVDGRLAWAVHLYAVSDRFPLSQRWPLGSEAVGYARLAATAVVDAATGAVQLVPVPTPDPVARAWLSLIGPLVVPPPSPTLGTPGGPGGPGGAGRDVVEALPPATEGAVLQLRTLEAYGAAGIDPGLVHLPDSALSGGGPALQAVRTAGRPLLGWSLPVLTADGRVSAVATAVGGGARATWLVPVVAPGAPWDTIVRTLTTATGLVPPRGAAGGLPLIVRGDRGPLVVLAGPPGRVAVTDGAGVGAGATVVDAMRQLRPGVPRWRAASAAAARGGPSLGMAARQVDRMRAAMRRGDWAAFGIAFDSLARAVGRPPP